MKLLNKFLISVAAISLFACSSMDIDDSTAMEENFPADFDAAVYMELHPELQGLQIRDYVTSHNASVKSSLTSDAIKEDQALFFADTSILHKIYTSSILGGYSEENWVDVFSPVEKPEVACQVNNKFTVLNIKKVEESGDTTLIKIFDPITIVTDTEDSTKIISASGITDTVTNDEADFVFGDDLILPTGKNRGTTVLDTVKCDTIVTLIPGRLTRVDSNYLGYFNFTDSKDDWALLNKVPLDTLAFSLQYVMFGESHGWAYRKCKESELKNAPITEEYPVTKRYCVDSDGVVREIK